MAASITPLEREETKKAKMNMFNRKNKNNSN